VAESGHGGVFLHDPETNVLASKGANLLGFRDQRHSVGVRGRHLQLFARAQRHDKGTYISKFRMRHLLSGTPGRKKGKGN